MDSLMCLDIKSWQLKTPLPLEITQNAEWRAVGYNNTHVVGWRCGCCCCLESNLVRLDCVWPRNRKARPNGNADPFFSLAICLNCCQSGSSSSCFPCCQISGGCLLCRGVQHSDIVWPWRRVSSFALSKEFADTHMISIVADSLALLSSTETPQRKFTVAHTHTSHHLTWCGPPIRVPFSGWW